MDRETVDHFETSELENQAHACVRALFRAVAAGARDLQAHDVERDILEQIREIGRGAMRHYFLVKGTGDVGATLVDENGRVYRRENPPRSRTYQSVFGKIDVARTAYRAEGVPAAIFPLDATANLPTRQYSYVLQEWMALAAQSGAYREELDKTNTLTGVRLRESVAQDVVGDVGRHYDEFYEQKKPPKPASELDVLAVGFDGKGVPMIAAEAAKLKARRGDVATKKMATVGLCYDVGLKDRDPETIARNLVYKKERKPKNADAPLVKDDPPRAYNVRRLASVTLPKDAVFDAIEAEATARDPEHQRTLAVLIDGELVLEKQARKRFAAWSSMHVILDLMHVLSYLWRVAAVFCGTGNAHETARQAFVFERLMKILNGKVGLVIGGLKSARTKRALSGSRRREVDACITYFENHAHMMAYDVYLLWGLPITTGVVESACGSVVHHRMEGAGMRWSSAGAEAILRLRSLRGSDGDWQRYWSTYPSFEQTRNYARTLNILSVQAA